MKDDLRNDRKTLGCCKTYVCVVNKLDRVIETASLHPSKAGTFVCDDLYLSANLDLCV